MKRGRDAEKTSGETINLQRFYGVGSICRGPPTQYASNLREDKRQIIPAANKQQGKEQP
jgi:hypothetical protein